MINDDKKAVDQNAQILMVTESIAVFLTVSREQERTALKAHVELISMLNRLNGAFNRLPDVVFSGPALPPMMISQSQAAFLAAVRMSLSGQVHVAYMALRGCIESALYGLIMSRQPSTQLAWVNRAKDPALSRKLFTARVGLAALTEIDNSLSEVLTEAYEVAIDHGAHPNLLSLGKHLDFSGWDESNELTNILLLPADSIAVRRALGFCVEVGAAVASLSAHVIPEHAPAVAAHEEAIEVIGSYLSWIQEPEPKSKPKPKPKPKPKKGASRRS